MEKTMHKALTMAALMVAVTFAVAVGTANAQSGGRKVVATIPFEFVVGNETLPAGDYYINSATSSGDVLAIHNDKTEKSIVRLTNSLQPNLKNTRSRLIFHRYGQNYFLAEVWAGGDSSGRRLLESKQERAIRREMGIARASNFERVELAANGR